MAVPAFQRLVLRAIAVLLVHESTGDRASAGVHVLVSTPAGKVNAPVVQLQLDVSGCVGEIPADEDSAGVGVGGDCGVVFLSGDAAALNSPVFREDASAGRWFERSTSGLEG